MELYTLLGRIFEKVQRTPKSEHRTLASFWGQYDDTLLVPYRKGPNLLQNPGFEVWSVGDPVSWTDYRGDSEEEASEVQEGSRSNKFVLRTFYTGSCHQDFDGVKDEYYEARVWLRLNTNWRFVLNIWDLDSQAVIATTGPVYPMIWTEYALPFVATSTNLRFQVYVYMQPIIWEPDKTWDGYIDGAQVEMIYPPVKLIPYPAYWADNEEDWDSTVNFLWDEFQWSDT